MGYAEIADLDRFGINADALRDMDADTKGDALDAASSLADSYLRGRYTMPLVSWGDDLRRAVVGIAVYDLMSNRGFDEQGDAQIRKKYDDAIAWLKEVARNQAHPEILDSSGSSTTGTSARGRPRVVSSSGRGLSSRGENRDRGPFESD